MSHFNRFGPVLLTAAILGCDNGQPQPAAPEAVPQVEHQPQPATLEAKLKDTLRNPQKDPDADLRYQGLTADEWAVEFADVAYDRWHPAMEALTALGTRTAVDFLVCGARNKDDDFRLEAVSAIGKVGRAGRPASLGALPLLKRLAKSDPNKLVRNNAQWAVEQIEKYAR